MGFLKPNAYKAKEPESSKTLAQLSEQLYGQTDPVRQALIDQASQFLSGGFDLSSLPQYAALKNAVESQYGRARENVLGSVAGGGSLSDALADVEIGRAGSLVQGIGGIANDQLALAQSLATGSPLSASFGGLGQAAGIQGSLANANAQRNTQLKMQHKETAGQIAGSIAGGMAA